MSTGSNGKEDAPRPDAAGKTTFACAARIVRREFGGEA